RSRTRKRWSRGRAAQPVGRARARAPQTDFLRQSRSSYQGDHPMRGPSPRGEKLGPLGDKVLFENEFVRIWSVKLDPGERQAWHQHQLPYIIVPMTEGKNIMYFEDG